MQQWNTDGLIVEDVDSDCEGPLLLPDNKNIDPTFSTAAFGPFRRFKDPQRILMREKTATCKGARC